MWRVSHLLVILTVFSCFSPLAYGTEISVPAVIKLTGHPAVDFEPSVSPDDGWIVFTSFRDGDFNIYQKSSSRGLPIALTNHTSADYGPCYDNRGEAIFFVSRRDDALGDIYRLSLETKGIERITNRQGYDIDPTISPDGEYMAFCSDRETGYLEVFIANKNGEILKRITTGGGIGPCWSPDGRNLAFISLDATGLGGDNRLAIADTSGQTAIIDTGPGPVMNPKYSPDGNLIFFTQYCVDTDKDGELTLRDISSISGYDLESRRTIKFIFKPDAVYNPVPDYQGKWLYFTVADRSGVNLAKSDFSTLSKLYSSPESLYHYGMSLAASVEPDRLLAAIQYLEACAALYPSFEHSAVASITCGDIYRQIGYYREADLAWVLADSISLHPADKLLARIRRVHLEADRNWLLDRRSALKKALNSLDELLEQSAGDPTIVPEIHYAAGILLFRYGSFGEALASFQTVIDSFLTNVETSSRALLRMADLYSAFNPDDRLSNAINYLKVISIFSDENDMADSAVVYALREYEDLPPMDRIDGIRHLMESFSESKLLRTAGEYHIAGILEEGGNPYSAIDQYTTAFNSSAKNEIYGHEARLRAARLKIATGAADEGVAGLDSLLISDNISDLVRKKAEDELYNYLLGIASASFEKGEFDRSLLSFQDLMGRFPERGDCHWGFVMSASQKGDFDYAQDVYDSLEEMLGGNRGIAYGRALLSLEKYESRGNKSDLKRSRELLENLNDEYFEWIFPYIALGKVYLKFEAGNVAPEESGFSERAIDISTIGISNLNSDSPPKLRSSLELNAATGYFNIGQFSQAFSYYRNCYEFVVQCKDEKLLTDYLWNLGESALQIDSLKVAAECFLQLLRIAEENSDGQFRLQLVKKLGFVYMLDENYDDARRYFELALEIYRSRSDKRREAAMLKALATVNFIDMENDQCIALAEKSDSIYVSMAGIGDIKTTGMLLGRLPLLPVDFQIAELEEFKIGGSFYPKGLPFNISQRLLRNYEGESDNRRGDVDAAASYFKAKMQSESDAGDRKSMAITCNRLGNLYQNAGNPDSAFVYYQRALEISKEAEILSGAAINAVNLCNLMLAYPELKIGINSQVADRMESILTEMLEKLPGEVSDLKMHLHCAIGTHIFTRFRANTEKIAGDYEHNLMNADGLESATAKGHIQMVNFGPELGRVKFHYRTAGIIAQRLENKFAQAAINLNLTVMYFDLGLLSDFQNSLSKTRELAIENGFNDILWRALMLKGISDPDPNSSLGAFEDAIKVVRTLRGDKNPFAFREEQSELGTYYSAYLQKLLDSDRTEDAFDAIELQKAMALTGEFSRYPLRDFRSELHKVYWQNIRYFDQMVDSLTTMIRALEIRKDISALKAIDSLNLELGNIRDELGGALEKIRTEFPALVPMVYPSAPDRELLKTILGSQGCILNYREFEEGMGIWYIDNETIEFSFRTIDIDSLDQMIGSIQDSLRSPSDDTHLKALFDILVGDNLSRIENKSHLYIIPDRSLWRIPFSALNDGNTFLSDICDYSISSSVAMIINGYQNRKVPSDEVMFVPSKSSLPSEDARGFSVASVDSIPDALSGYGVLIFGGGIQIKDGYPLGSRLTTPLGRDPQLSDLLKYKLNCRAVILKNSEALITPEVVPILQSVFNYAGSSSLIICRWTVPDSIFNRFIDLLVPRLSETDVATALGSARSEMRTEFSDPRYWAGFEQVGFHGMDKAMEMAFAQQQFNEIMLKANIAAREGIWEDAQEYFERAFQLSANLKLEPAKIDVLLQRTVFSAFKAGNFRIAEKYQKMVLEITQSKGDTLSIGKALLLLRDIANSGCFFESAASYQRDYMQLVSAQEDSFETSIGFRNIASLYDSGAKYELGITAIDSSLACLPPSYRGKELAASEFIRGRILINTGDYRKALLSLQTAVDIYDSLASSERAAAYQLMGFAYLKRFEYIRAQDYLELAYNLYHNSSDSTDAARCAQMLSSAEWAIGDYDSAEELADFAAKYNRRRGDNKSLLDALLIKALTKIYSGYKSEGQKLLIDGLALADSLKLQMHRAAFSDNLGRFFLREKQYSKAIDYLRIAITIDREGLGNRRDRVEMLFDLALSISGNGNPEAALEYIAEADSLINSVPDDYLRTKYHLILGIILASNNKLKEAINYVNDKRDISNSARYEELQWRSEYLLAKCYYDAHNLSSSLEAIMKAASILDSIPVIPEGELLRSRLPYHPADVYRLLAAVQFAKGDYESALGSFQKSSQYSQASLLSSYRYHFKDSGLDSLVSRLQNSQIEYCSILNIGHLESADARQEHIGELGRRRERYFASLESLKSASPAISLLFDVPALEMTSVSNALAGSKAIFYFMDGNELYRFITNGDHLDAAHFVTTHNLSDIARQYYSTVTSLGQTARLELLLQPYLVGGLENELKGASRIIVVPSGDFAGLPFNYLIPKLSGSDSASMVINVLPSLYDTYIRDGGQESREMSGVTCLLPDYDEMESRGSFWVKAINRQKIRQVYPLILSSNFIEALLSQNVAFLISNLGIDANDGNPLNFALGGADTMLAQGTIRLRNLLENHRDIGFIVEGATGGSMLSKLSPENTRLLWRILLCSGLSGVILPYWENNDFERGLFLKHYLRQIETSKPDIALSKTQREIMNSGKLHPYYWAGYCYMGFVP